MRSITILTDYKGYFGHKQKTPIYGCGMDLKLLSSLFEKYNYHVVFVNFAGIDFFNNWKGKIVLYTSSEDKGYYYKDFIEDVIFGLEKAGAIVLPSYQYLRANNNKVFMEIYRKLIFSDNNLKSSCFGTLEELLLQIDSIQYPIVIKEAKGAMSNGVSLAKGKSELINKAKKMSSTPNIKFKLWEIAKYIRRNGRIKISSTHRKKFVLQEFVEGLDGDYKVLVYGDKYFMLQRKNRKNDFRASGSGIFNFLEDPVTEILNFAESIYQEMNVPNVSLDIASNGEKCFLIEYQAIHFGTKTLEYSSGYFTKETGSWLYYKQKSVLEEIYVESIISYLNSHEGSLR